MITLHGTPTHNGIVIAEAAIITSEGGLNGLSPELLQKGIASIRRGAPESETPEVAVICDLPQTGLSLKLPGLKVAAIATESDSVQTEDGGLPCVTGVQDLLETVSNGDIVIVDGTRGVVYVDPDAETLIHYQSADERQTTRRVFLGSAHIPAVTPSGRTIAVFASLSDIFDASGAIQEGADGLLLTESAVSRSATADWSSLIEEAAGLPLLLLSAPPTPGLEILMQQSLPLQTTIAVRARGGRSVLELREMMQAISDDLSEQDCETADILVGAVVDATDQDDTVDAIMGAARFVIDATVCEYSETQARLADCISRAVSAAATYEKSKRLVPMTVLLASSIDSIHHLTYDGLDSIAAPMGFISAAKDLIRSLPVSE